MLLKGNVLGCHRPQRRSQCHTRARLDLFVIRSRRTRLRQNNLQSSRGTELAPDAAYARSREETSLASFEIFSAAAGLRARSETAGTTSPRLKAVRSPPQCSRAPPDALLCRDAPKPIFTGNIPSLSAQNSPRTASQRVRSIAHSAKVVIFACAQPRPLTLSRWSAYFAQAPAPLAAYGS